MAREMKIGIMSRKDFENYTIAIAKGEIKPANGAPKIFFESLESMAQVLSTKNRELLKTIQEKQPKSLTELAVTSGRQRSNLTRTLKTMERYGIVELHKESGTVKPLVCVDSFEAVFGF
ncbi:MAG: MarR family transcriptional regulator [Syntrophales bacterium]|nr:MarR family transcriptional regulator [Syntrophales bacterium]